MQRRPAATVVPCRAVGGGQCCAPGGARGSRFRRFHLRDLNPHRTAFHLRGANARSWERAQTAPVMSDVSTSCHGRVSRFNVPSSSARGAGAISVASSWPGITPPARAQSLSETGSRRSAFHLRGANASARKGAQTAGVMTQLGTPLPLNPCRRLAAADRELQQGESASSYPPATRWLQATGTGFRGSQHAAFAPGILTPSIRHATEGGPALSPHPLKGEGVERPSARVGKGTRRFRTRFGRASGDACDMARGTRALHGFRLCFQASDQTHSGREASGLPFSEKQKAER